MSYDITHCTTTICPRRDTCRRSVAWQKIVTTDYGHASATDGVACQQDKYAMHWAYTPPQPGTVPTGL